MGGRHTVDLLGAKGVNVVKTPLEMDDSELTSGQNAQFYREQGVAGLRDRSGLPTHSLSSMGASANGGIGLPLPAPGAAGGSPLYVARTASPGYTISGSFAFASKPTPSTGANDVRAFVYAPGLRRWVAVGDGGLVLTSDDGGLTWTTRVAAEANGWRDVAWNGQTFVAVAGGGTHRVMLSYDGVVWFAQTAAEANGWQGVCWSDALNLWCAVANSGVHRVMTSPDGISWSAQTAAAAKQWLGVAWSPELSLFAAVSLDATTCIQTSPDGVTWTSRTTGTNVHSGGPSSGNSTIVWSSEIRLFAFPSFNGTTWFATTSTDGVTWTDQTLANQVGNSGIVAVAGLLVIMQELGGGGATNPYMFSSNGSSWTQGDTGVSKTWLCAGGAVEGATAMIVAWDNNLSFSILRGAAAVTNPGKQWIKSADFGVSWNPDSTLSRPLDATPRSLRTAGGVTIYLGATPGLILGWDGAREYVITRLPSPSTVQLRRAALLCANGQTIYAVGDDGTTQRAYAVNVVTGATTAIGAALTLTSDDLVAGAFYMGRLWVSSRNKPLDITKVSHIYSLRPLAETTWTTERSSVISVGSNRFQYGDLGTYNGVLYVAANTQGGAAAILEARTPGGVWSTALTGPDSAAGDVSQFGLVRGLPGVGLFVAYYDLQSGADHTGRFYLAGDGVTFTNELDYLANGGVGVFLGSWMAANFQFVTVQKRIFQRTAQGVWSVIDSDALIVHGLILGT